MKIAIPMDPPSGLLPNRQAKQGSWHRRAELRRTVREVAKYAALERADLIPIAGPVHLTLHVAYGVDPVTRRARQLPDLDGTIAAAKPMIDGIVDAGILYDDDQVQRMTASHERLGITRKERPTGYTIIEIQEIDA